MPTSAAITLEKREYPDDSSRSAMSGLARYCMDLYDEYRESDYRLRKLDEIEDSRRMYVEHLDEKSGDDAWRSNLTLGLAAVVVDAIEPKIMASLFGDANFVHLSPVGEEDAARVAAAKEAVTYLMTTNMRAEAQLRPAVHDLIIDGTQFLLPMWEETVETFPTRETIPMFDGPGGRVPIPRERLQDPMVMQAVRSGMLRPAGEQEIESERDVSSFRVAVDRVPVTEAFFPDTGDDWDEQPFLRFIYPTFAELSALSGDDGPYKDIDESLVEQDARELVEDPDPDLEWKGIEGSDLAKEIAVLECYVKWRGEWTIASFAVNSGWREIRRQKVRDVYPYDRKPVRRWAIYRESNESLGTGLVRKVKHYAQGADDLYNQMIDAGTVQIMPWGFIEEGPGSIGLDLADVKPGEYRPVPPGTKIHDRQVAVTAGHFMPFIEMLMQMQERKVSLMDHTMTGGNRGTAGSETYAGMNLLLHESNIRHNYLSRVIKADLAMLVRDAVSLYAWFLPSDAKMRIFDGNQWLFQPVDIAAIQGQYDIEIEVANNQANTMLNRQQAIERYQLLAANPLVNQVKMLGDILASYDLKEIPAYVKPEINQVLQLAAQLGPQAAQILMQALQQKQQQMNQQKLETQARDNVQRSMIQRGIEEPVELMKTADQVSEQAQRKAMQPMADAGFRNA